MTRRARGISALVLMAAICLLAVLLANPRRQAVSSALSASSGGWLAARRYLEARGVAVEISDRPLGAESGAGLPPAPPGGPGGEPAIWVLAFPWQLPLGDGEPAALGAHLHAGGTVIVAYSEPPLRQEERDVLGYLGLEPRVVRGPAPLAPWRWWSYHRETWELSPGDGWSEGAAPPGLVVPALRMVPRAPEKAAVLYGRASPKSAEAATAEDAVPVVFSYRWRGGFVLALPASALSNAYLLETGQADFLESLSRAAAGGFRFDEYHHGLVNAGLVTERGSTFVWDLFLLHLAVFYALGLLAVARRFGPAWREAVVAAGSTSAFLRNLGALHRELRHHQAAARLLAARARELDPALPEVRPPAVAKDDELVAFARQMTHISRRRNE